MSKLLLTGLTLMVVIAGVTAAFAAQSGNAPQSPATTTPGGAVDISGNCDEAEHAQDPECQGVRGDDDRDRGNDDRRHHGGDDGRGRDHPEDDGTVGDISGNCDEAEHAQDPECQGVADNLPSEDDPERQHVDNSGPGSISSHDDDLVEDDDVDDDDDFDDDTGTGQTRTATGTNTGGHGG